MLSSTLQLYEQRLYRMIPLQNLSKHSNVVLLSILMYSSIASVATPYANIRIVVVHLANGDKPSLLAA